jgi:hypothetical protein
MREIPKFNKTKGPYKPPKYRCFGLEAGVPFTRVYRSLRSVKKLGKKNGITHFDYVLLS